MNNFENRKFVIILIFLLVGIIYVFRLLYIQVIDDKWEKEAESIVQKMVSIHPSRGLIKDRNGKLLVENAAVYDLMVTPRKISSDFDTINFCKLLDIRKQDFEDKMDKAWGAYERYISETIYVPKRLYKKHKAYLDTLSGFYFSDSPRKIGFKRITIIGGKTRVNDTNLLVKNLGTSKKLLIKELKRAWRIPIRGYSGQYFEKLIPANQFENINNQLYKYPGFYKQENTIRNYPDSMAAHVLGYIREIDGERLRKDTSDYYKRADYIGLTGIESQYETELRGIRGLSYYLADVYNNQKEVIKNENTEIAVPGKTLYTTLDAELQKYGEKLMQNKTGSIVAIEPSTGEILALISAPSYDPNLLVGRNLSGNYMDLLKDTLKPLNNRAISAMYRPGSTFKLIESLIGMEMGVITENTGFHCNKALIGCHNHEYPANIKKAIQHSCNPYYYMVYKKIIQRGQANSIYKDSELGLIEWTERVKKFGLGIQLDTDLPGLRRGRVPDTTFYNRWYGKGKYAFTYFRSNSIGEGELAVTPIQMANLAATIANRGYYYPPHLVRKIGEDGSKKEEFLQKNYVGVDTNYFRPVIDGMELVIKAGTARRAYINDSLIVCGKTGTVQNGDFRDHSGFIAFAPKETPQIAIAVYVEYGGFGGTYAAPIASLMIEKYLTDTITNKAKEKRILNSIIVKDQPIIIKE